MDRPFSRCGSDAAAITQEQERIEAYMRNSMADAGI